jgi:hypothetical protein
MEVDGSQSAASASRGGRGDLALHELPPTVRIVGVDIQFPRGKKPFPPQLAVMSGALRAMKASQHALLESRTFGGARRAQRGARGEGMPRGVQRRGRGRH